jgi:hypothetical protein
VCRFKKFEPAKLHIWNIATDKLNLHLGAVLRRTEEHSLRLKTYTCFAVRQDLGSNVSSLIGLVTHIHELRPLNRVTIGPQVLCEPFLSKIDNGGRCRENQLCRSIIPLQSDDFGAWIEVIRKIKNIADRGSTECKPNGRGLTVVGDDAQSIYSKRQKDGGLKTVSILILVYQHVVEAARNINRNRRLRHHLRPIE